MIRKFHAGRPGRMTATAPRTQRGADDTDNTGTFTGIQMAGAELLPDVTHLPVPPSMFADPYNNKALDGDVYGGQRISFMNRYDRFQQLENVLPRVGLGLAKLGMKLRGPEFKLFIPTDAGLSDEIANGLLQDARKFDLDLNLQDWFAVAGKLMARDGTLPILNSADRRFGSGEGITTLDVMPMSHTTLLPIDATPMTAYQNIEQIWEWGTLTGNVTQVIINERNQAKREIHYLKNGRVTLFRFMHQGHQCRDIYNRRTIGLYGVSIMELLDQNAIKPLADIIWGFSKAIGRYGFERLQIENELLAKMVADKTISMDKAGKIMQKEQAVVNNLTPNRDLVTIGKKVSPVGGSFSAADGVIRFKESLERDISYGLMETEAGSGKARGSTFASANISDQDANRVLQSMRMTIREGFEDIIHRHLELLGWEAQQAQQVRIQLAPIQLPPQEIAALLQFDAQYPGIVAPEQMLEMCGLEIPPHATIGPDSARPPTTYKPEEPGNPEPEVPGPKDDQSFKMSSLLPPYLVAARQTYAAEHARKRQRPLRLTASVDNSGHRGQFVQLCGCWIFVREGDSEEEAFQRDTGMNLSAACNHAATESQWEKSGGWPTALKSELRKHGVYTV